MPNWVYNTLTIQGPKGEIDSIKDRLNKPFTLAIETHGMGDINANGFPTKFKEVTYSNPVFAFFNIHSYKDDGITDEEYACQPDRGGINLEDPDWFRKSVEFDKYPETELIEYKSDGHDNWLVYKYETAWSPAITILQKLSHLVPNSLLTLEYEEEQGWGGEYEILRGDVKELISYDNRCYACDSYDTLDYCEDDCGQFCSSCNQGSWQDEEAMAKCQTHMLLLESKGKVEA